MPPFSRGQVAYRVGERLQTLSGILRALPEVSSKRVMALGKVEIEMNPVIRDLTDVRDSCRKARMMYSNYPALRRAILDAGEKVGEYYDQIVEIKEQLHERIQRDPNGDFNEMSAVMLLLGTNLKLLDFSPRQKQDDAPKSFAPGVGDPSDRMD